MSCVNVRETPLNRLFDQSKAVARLRDALTQGGTKMEQQSSHVTALCIAYAKRRERITGGVCQPVYFGQSYTAPASERGKESVAVICALNDSGPSSLCVAVLSLAGQKPCWVVARADVVADQLEEGQSVPKVMGRLRPQKVRSVLAAPYRPGAWSGTIVLPYREYVIGLG